MNMEAMPGPSSMPSEESPEKGEKKFLKVVEFAGIGAEPKELFSGEFDSPEAAAQAYYNQDPGSRAMIDLLDSEGNPVDFDDGKIDRMGGRGPIGG
jgi:hypothetical protein